MKPEETRRAPDTRGIRGDQDGLRRINHRSSGWETAGTLAVLVALCGCGGAGSSGGTSGGGGSTTPTITSVTASCSPSSITVTQSATCSATVSGTGAFSSSVSWSVSPSNIGTISSSGVFTPAIAGTATITATSTQDPTKTGNASLTAVNTTALAISITDLPTGSAGAVTVTDPNGQQAQVTTSEIIPAIPGTYTITAASVTLGSSTFVATSADQTAQITSGNVTSVVIDYYNVIPSTTKVLDSAGVQSLQISTDGTTLTVTPDSAVATSLQVGDVLVVPPTSAGGVAPSGLLRKVTSVSSTPSAIIIGVQAANLAEAFQRVSLQLTNQSVASDIRVVRTMPGVTFHPGAVLPFHSLRQSVSGASVSAFQDPCAGSSLGVLEITGPVNFQPADGLTVQGQVEICSGFDFKVDIVGTGFLGLQPQLNSLTATATVGESADLTLQGEFLDGSFNPDPIVLATLVGAPIPVPGLPIWVTPEVSVFVGASGNVSAGFSTEAAEAGSLTGGVTYASGQWTPVLPTPSFQSSFTPPNIDASLNAKAYAGVDLTLSVWDIVGPSFKPDGYIDFNADITANPWWTLTGGVEGPMSLDVGFLGENIANYDLGNLFDYSYPIASAGGPFSPAASNPVIQALSPSQATAGGTTLNLSVAGSNFVPGAVIAFGNIPLVTTWQGPGALSGTVPASLIAQAATVPVTVSNSGTGAGTSAAVNFTITPPTGEISISPSSVSVPLGEVQTFSATVSGGGGVTWTVQEGSAGGAITGVGVYTAPTQIGTYHVIATDSANTAQTATAVVNVIAGPTVTTIHSFDHTKEGANPSASLILSSSGAMYGTTEAGGDLSCAYISTLEGCGTIFSTDTSGDVSTLHSFTGTDGAYPVAALLSATGGTLYGTTLYGGSNYSSCDVGGTTTLAGCGTIFTYDSAGNFTSIYSFGPYNSSIGVGPDAPLIQASDGMFYGTAYVGGNTACAGSTGTVSRSGCGAIFDLTATSAPASLHAFAGSEGAYPGAALLPLNGNFYSTTAGGGTLNCTSYASPGCGTIFEMTPGGAITSLYAFSGSDGADPSSTLTLASDGSMYGTTSFGGGIACNISGPYSGCGTVFKIDAAGHFTSLHSFSGPDGAYPNRIMQASDGNFYGTTFGGGDAACAGKYGPGCGVVFRMDSAGNVTVLYAFTGASDGSWPAAGLIVGADSNLYGSTQYGGVNDDGVLFRISGWSSSSAGSAAVAAPEKQVIVPISAHNIHVAIPRPAMLPN